MEDVSEGDADTSRASARVQGFRGHVQKMRRLAYED